MNKERTTEIVLVTIFITIMAASNLAIASIGPWFLPVTAFISVGLVLVTRDYLHDVWAERGYGFWPRMLAMIATAALISYALDPSSGRISLASVSALVAAALTETATFQALINRRWLVRSNGSNVMGALADSITFPLVAFGPGMKGIIWLIITQATIKTLGGLFWSIVAKYTINPDKRRADRRARKATSTATSNPTSTDPGRPRFSQIPRTPFR